MLDLTGIDTDEAHKQAGSVTDVMSPPPSAFCLLGSESSSTPANAPPPPFHTDLPATASDGLLCANVHKSFHWPGIDAVMESYQLYLEGNFIYPADVLFCLGFPFIGSMQQGFLIRIFLCAH